MPDLFVITTILSVIIALCLFSLLYGRIFYDKYQQRKTDRRRRRAHAGKVLCEDEDCAQIAVCLTPNGYFCDFHWEPMSKRMLSGGGYITWHHVLYHSIRRS